MARHHVPTRVALTASALFLAGCSSSGTIGERDGSSSKGSSSGSSAGSSGGAAATVTATSDDRGCTIALSAIQDAMKLQGSKDKKAVINGMHAADTQLRRAVDNTEKPGAKETMLRLADDLTFIMIDTQQGKDPGLDTSNALKDARMVTELCGAEG